MQPRYKQRPSRKIWEKKNIYDIIQEIQLDEGQLSTSGEKKGNKIGQCINLPK